MTEASGRLKRRWQIEVPDTLLFVANGTIYSIAPDNRVTPLAVVPSPPNPPDRREPSPPLPS